MFIIYRLNTHYELYNALRTVRDKGDIFEMAALDEHIANLFLFDFEQNGIHLPESDRTMVVNLNDAILHLGQHFMSGASNYRAVNKKSLPEHVQRL